MVTGVKANKIMLQGTASSVGKSILTAALCRIFRDDGFKVAPFKSQNMALNSFVTKDGKEMGRAQVVQAEAARIAPRVEMNPILLKPSSDVGCQVIVNGKVWQNMNAKQYGEMKLKLKDLIMAAYHKLSKEYEIIVIEGAGSAAEINLRENDIVNMGLAEMLAAPVILIADIDKGGVFASLYGTVMLLEESERKRIKGFIINKFRGDLTILEPGIKMIEEKINKPCLGVVPYMEINIDDEDSVTTRFNQRKDTANITIVIIKLPYLSMLSDFTPLELEKDVRLIYATRKEQLAEADLLIIPGSKNTLYDMKFIKNKGMDAEIYKLHKKGVPIVGICGGYQMLGLEMLDPGGVESTIGQISGLALLNIKTVMQENKTTKQVEGKLAAENAIFKMLENKTITGYEIHKGVTEIIGDCKPLIVLADGRQDGAINESGNVFGTYLHGLFENNDFRRQLINTIKEKKGLEKSEDVVDFAQLKDAEYDKLALIVRENVDIPKIYKIMSEKYVGESVTEVVVDGW